MSGDLEPALVYFVHRGCKLRTRDVHVRLERRRARVGPEINHAPRVARILELVHLPDAESRTLQIRRTRIDPRTGFVTIPYRARNVDIAIAVHVAASAHGRHTTGEIQTRETLRHVAVHTRTGRIEQVLVHHHEPGNHRLAGKIEHLRVRRWLDRGTVTQLGDLPITQNQRLVGTRWCASSVDDAYVSQRDDRCVDGDVLPHVA